MMNDANSMVNSRIGKRFFSHSSLRELPISEFSAEWAALFQACSHAILLKTQIRISVINPG